jgi:hypothetical protein
MSCNARFESLLLPLPSPGGYLKSSKAGFKVSNTRPTLVMSHLDIAWGAGRAGWGEGSSRGGGTRDGGQWGGEGRLKRGGEGAGDVLFGVVGFTPSPRHSHDPGTPDPQQPWCPSSCRSAWPPACSSAVSARCGWTPMRSTKSPWPTAGRTSASSSRTASSSASPRRSTRAPALAVLLRPSGRAATPATASAAVPGRPGFPPRCLRNTADFGSGFRVLW